MSDRANRVADDDRARRPIDTAEPPFEPSVDIQSTVGLWLLVLAGPTLWTVHFFAVYLAAEAACAAEGTSDMTFISPAGTGVFIVLATVVGVLLAGAAGVVCRVRQNRPDAPGLLRVGALLAALSAVAILLVGLPILALPVCSP